MNYTSSLNSLFVEKTNCLNYPFNLNILIESERNLNSPLKTTNPMRLVGVGPDNKYAFTNTNWLNLETDVKIIISNFQLAIIHFDYVKIPIYLMNVAHLKNLPFAPSS